MFGKGELEFYGYKFTKEGLKQTERKVDAVKSCAPIQDGSTNFNFIGHDGSLIIVHATIRLFNEIITRSYLNSTGEKKKNSTENPHRKVGSCRCKMLIIKCSINLKKTKLTLLIFLHVIRYLIQRRMIQNMLSKPSLKRNLLYRQDKRRN